MKFQIVEAPKATRAEPGFVLLQAGCAQEALPYLKNMVYREPNARRLNDLGASLKYLGDFEEAEAYLRRAIELDAKQPSAWANLGLVLADLGRFEEAHEAYERAWSVLCSMDPKLLATSGINPQTIAFPLMHSYLRFGQNEKAWPLWQMRHSVSRLQGLAIWRGQDLAGKKVLVTLDECGFGDIFWLIRYLPKLRERGAHVTVYGWKSLKGILGDHPWIDRWLDERDLADTDEFDFQVRLWALMGLFNLCPLGMDEPYLKAEPYKPDDWTRPRVGICWKAEDSSFRGLKTRLIERDVLEKFKDLPFRFVSLHFGKLCPSWVEDVGAVLQRGWEGTAQVIAGLDLVISVDTAVAHLAGAMGKETWVLVPCAADWKFGFNSDTSPWYPSWELFHSNDPLSSAPAVERLIESLSRMEVPCPA